MTDPCRCEHDFLDHTRITGEKYTSARTEVACSVCDCEDFIPTPHTEAGRLYGAPWSP